MSPDQDRLTETELREICELWLERHDLDETDEQTDNSRDVHGRKKLSGMQALALEGLKKRENSEWRGAGIEVPDLRVIPTFRLTPCTLISGQRWSKGCGSGTGTSTG